MAQTAVVSALEDRKTRTSNPMPWIVVSFFLLSNTLNYLDRQLLAAVAPFVRRDYGLSNTQYGELLSAFALVYAATAPFVGALVDRLGLLRSSVAAVCSWSVASLFTGFTGSFGGLLLARVGLGIGEAAALPCSSKAAVTYLAPSEWGLASAIGSIGVTIGSVGAPLLAGFLEPQFGWRAGFLFAGGLGFAWILIWLLLSRMQPGRSGRDQGRASSAWYVLRDKRLWGLVFCYAMVMTVYIFWLSWTTLYLVDNQHLSPAQANRFFSWIPPLFATVGGLLSGGLAFRYIRNGADPCKTRMRIAWISAPLIITGAVVPFIPSTPLAVLAIGASLLFSMSFITSLNIIPVDLFGRENAAFSAALLATGFSLMQAFVAPIIGRIVDRVGFEMLCVVLSCFPLVGIVGLQFFLRKTASAR